MGKQEKKATAKEFVPIRHLLILAFLEGATVMAVELLGAKMITPYFGSSLVVWTAVIGVTLVCLTTGYFVGGRLSTRANLLKILFFLLAVSAFLIANMSNAAHSILRGVGDINVYAATVLSALFLFGLPLMFLGATSPIIIRLITEDVKESGKNAGRVYAISTVGGIFMTFFLGFFIIPAWGITGPSVVAAAIMLIAAAGFLFNTRRLLWAGGIGLLIVWIGFKVLAKENQTSPTFNILYRSEGLLGQLKVLDEYYPDIDVLDRSMLVNGIPQTFIEQSSAESYWYYVHMISTLAKVKPAGANVLLLGFGGGSLARELSNSGFNIDAVELDGRMWDLAQDYFQYDPVRTEFIVDDARHYINTTEYKYDLIICDLIKGEVQPPYVLTQQSFRHMRENLLEPEGAMVINFQGQANGDRAKPFRSLLKTMQAAEYGEVYYTYTNCEEDSPCDIVIVGTDSPIDWAGIPSSRFNQCCISEPAVFEFVKTRSMSTIADVDLSDGLILDDDKPILEHMNLTSIMNWRITMIESTTKIELEQGISIFD